MIHFAVYSYGKLTKMKMIEARRQKLDRQHHCQNAKNVKLYFHEENSYSFGFPAERKLVSASTVYPTAVTAYKTQH